MQKFYPLLCKPNAFFKTLALALFSILVFTQNTKAQEGTNLSYDGVDDFVTLPTGIVAGVTGDFTIETYVFWRNTTPTTNFPRIFDFGIDGNNFIFLTAAIPFGSTGPRFAIRSAGVDQVIDATTTLTTNAWNHIAITVNASTNTGTMYINGFSVGTTAGFTFRLSTIGSTTMNFLGGMGQFPNPYFDGNIEEFRISNNLRYTGNFNMSLPYTTQFTSDMNTHALYHFNEGSGQQTANSSGVVLGNGILGAATTGETTDPTWIFGSILPIKLAAFSANTSANGKTVDLKWTASLDNAGEFIVERSSNGSNFTPIGTVNSTTGAIGLQNFSFRDNSPLRGRSYYRLKGSEAGLAPVYSRIVPVSINGKNELVVYPNPVKGNLINIELAKAFSGDVQIKISNTSGAVVLTQKIQALNKREFQINRNAKLPAGSYLIEVTAGNEKQSKMIVCQ